MKSLENLREYVDRVNLGGISSAELHSWGMEIADEIEREVAERYMKLPVDADGVPIHVGDVVQFRNDAPVVVNSLGMSSIYENDSGFFARNGGFYGQGTLKNVRHVKPRTLFDVLAEVENGELSIDDAAAEIRELMGVGE